MRSTECHSSFCSRNTSRRDVFSDHMQTYAKEFVSRYARLSSLLEVDLLLAQQAARQVYRTLVDLLGSIYIRSELKSSTTSRYCNNTINVISLV